MRNKRLRAAWAAGGSILVLLAALTANRAAHDRRTPESSEEAVPAAALQTDTTPSLFETGTVPAAETTTQTTARPVSAEKQAEPVPEAAGFVSLTEAVPDAILEMRYYTTYNFVGARIDGYEAPCALLTQEAAAALREVSDEMNSKGYRLKIYDAYRPQSAVDHFIRWANDPADTRMKPFFYPELDKSVLFDSGYISRHSAHSRGSTVDLTLFDMLDGREVDMGGTFDYFGQRSHPGFSGISQEQYANRRLLHDAMTAHGFHGISTEWWHFTLDDEPYPDTFFTFPVSPAVLP